MPNRLSNNDVCITSMIFTYKSGGVNMVEMEVKWSGEVK